MLRFLGLFQVVIILDSLMILAILASVVVESPSQGLLPLAGALAGLNAALQAWTLQGISTRIRTLLLAAGGATVVAMVLVGIFGLHH